MWRVTAWSEGHVDGILWKRLKHRTWLKNQERGIGVVGRLPGFRRDAVLSAGVKPKEREKKKKRKARAGNIHRKVAHSGPTTDGRGKVKRGRPI